MNNNNKLKISIALFPDVIESALQKFSFKIKYNIEWRKSEKKQNLKWLVEKKGLDWFLKTI